MSPAAGSTGADVRGTLNYAGSFSGRARLDTQEPQRSNFVLEPHDILIRDVRPARDTYKLHEHGFEFVKHRSAAAGDPELFEVSNVQQLLPVGPQERYADELVEFVQAYTGARVVVPQIGSFIARASSRARNKTWAQAAALVHLDYTLTSATQFVQWTADAWGITVPSHHHFAFIQTWRALSAGPQDNSLCVCDGGSVPPEDAVPIDTVMGSPDIPGTCFEFRLCKYRAGHNWYYLSNMEPDDVILFKGFDSRYPQAMNAMHCAFDNPLAGPDAAPRRSIEARFLAFFD